jgi:hypothetical protein
MYLYYIISYKNFFVRIKANAVYYVNPYTCTSYHHNRECTSLNLTNHFFLTLLSSSLLLLFSCWSNYDDIGTTCSIRASLYISSLLYSTLLYSFFHNQGGVFGAANELQTLRRLGWAVRPTKRTIKGKLTVHTVYLFYILH